jgi:hypothetical protein
MRAVALVLLGFASQAHALVLPSPVPEPGTLELLSIGVIAAVVVAIRKHRK